MILVCGWCRKEFEANITKNDDGERSLLICPHCGRLLPSSKKKLTGNLVGSKHIHEDYKGGNIAG
jgi:uncharacterized protein YbaR (Trm112 family)